MANSRGQQSYSSNSSQLNCPMKAKVGQMTVIYGHTPPSICRTHLEEMASQMGESIVSLSETLLTMDDEELYAFIKEFYEKKDPQLKEFFQKQQNFVNKSNDENTFEQVGSSEYSANQCGRTSSRKGKVNKIKKSMPKSYTKFQKANQYAREASTQLSLNSTEKYVQPYNDKYNKPSTSFDASNDCNSKPQLSSSSMQDKLLTSPPSILNSSNESLDANLEKKVQKHIADEKSAFSNNTISQEFEPPPTKSCASNDELFASPEKSSSIYSKRDFESQDEQSSRSVENFDSFLEFMIFSQDRKQLVKGSPGKSTIKSPAKVTLSSRKEEASASLNNMHNMHSEEKKSDKAAHCDDPGPRGSEEDAGSASLLHKWLFG